MKKMIRILSGLLLAAGFFYVLGVAGASDLDMIETSDIMRRGLIGLLIISGGELLGIMGGIYERA